MKKNRISNKLNELIKTRGISEAEFSAMLEKNDVNISVEEIVDICNFNRPVNDIEVMVFAECLDCSINDFFV